jgi:transcriptional regulator
LIKGIVGLEMRITRLEGKWKLGQNRSESDRHGVVDGLDALGSADMKHLVMDTLKGRD